MANPEYTTGNKFLDWLVRNNARQFYRDLEMQEEQILGKKPDYNAVDKKIDNSVLNFEDSYYHDDVTPNVPTNSNPGGYGLLPVSAKKQIDYSHADIAKQFGMGRSTAYQEALLNTAHQREVADLQAAGLNPVLSASGGPGAGSNVSVQPVTSSSAHGGGSGTSANGDFDIFGLIGGIVEIAGGIFGLTKGSASGAGSVAKGLKDIGKSF